MKDLRRQLERAGISNEVNGLYFDRQGRTIGQLDWMVLMEDDDYRRVARTDLPGYWVSTVWLGLDHSRGPTPRFFETAVFEAGPNGSGRVQEGGGISDIVCERWASEVEAREGHEQVVVRVRAWLEDAR